MGFDQFMNLVLDETIEEVSASERNEIGMVVVRGNSVQMMECLERTVDYIAVMSKQFRLVVHRVAIYRTSIHTLHTALLAVAVHSAQSVSTNIFLNDYLCSYEYWHSSHVPPRVAGTLIVV